MAMFDFNTMDILDRLGIRTNPGGFGGPTPTAAPTASAGMAAAAPVTRVAPTESFLSRIGALAKTAGRFAVSPGVVGAQAVTFSPEAGAGSDVILDTKTGKPLPSGGIPLTSAQVRRAGATPGVGLTGQQALELGSVARQNQQASEQQIATLEAQDAAAQRVADARTARVNEVIEASRAGRESDTLAAAQAAPFTSRISAPTQVPIDAAAPSFAKSGSFAGLSKLFGQTGQFLEARNRAALQNKVAREAYQAEVDREFRATENEKTRTLTREEKEADRAVNIQKILADFQKSLRPNPKAVTIKGADLTERPAIVDERGQGIYLDTDKEGRVTTRQIRGKPSESDMLAEGRRMLAAEKSPTKAAKLKADLNKQLEELGFKSRI